MKTGTRRYVLDFETCGTFTAESEDISQPRRPKGTGWRLVAVTRGLGGVIFYWERLRSARKET